MIQFDKSLNKPPLGAQWNWKHPFARNLVFCIPVLGTGADGSSGATLQTNVIWGKTSPRAQSSPGNPLFSSNSEGFCLNFTDAQAFILGDDPIPLTKVTICMIRRKTDTTFRTGTSFALGSAGFDSVTMSCQAFMPFSDGVVYWDYGGNASPNRLSVGGLSFSTTIPERWVFTAGPGGMSIWQNGKQVAVTTTSNPGRSITSPLRSFNINTWTTGSFGDAQNVNYFAVYNDEWDAKLCRLWSVDPYAALYPSPEEYYYFDNEFVSTSPFHQTEWPNPNLGKLNNLGFSGNPILFQTLSAPLQNKQTEWPNPLITKHPHVGYIDYDTFIDLNVKPNSSNVFPNRIERKKSGIDWTQNRPQFYQDDKPFKQDAWPNPELRLKSEKGHIHNRKLDEPPTPEPFKVPNYPNPLLKERIRPGYTDNFSLEETFTRPVASSTFDNPVPKKKGETLTWIQPRAFFYEEPAVIVFRQNSWPNPFIRKGLQGIINRHFIDTGVTTSPFNQNNWPLPLRKRIHPHWEDNYVLDDNKPFISQISFVPRGKSKFTPTWIQNLLLGPTDNVPVFTYNFPNPVIVKQNTLTWIDNLLQNNLDPGEGEKPFNQNDYPNPSIGLRLLHVGWLDGRKHYFDEPPLQIAQYDWPVFRAVIRNDVGFIHSQKQTEDPPKFVSVDNLPLVKNVLGITWIDNPLIVITAPPIIQPFSQKDWPNPRIKIPYFNNFNIFRPTSLIPPFIRGRRICLDAAFTIFDLEAMLEEYDLKARAEEYNFDTGGEECE